MATDTIPHRLFARGRARPDAPAFHQKIDGRYQATSWKAYAGFVRQAGRALLALGFEAKSTVSILGFNRPEWLILGVAAMAAGGAPAGIYTTCSPEEVRYIVDHAESPLVLVEDHAQLAKVEKEIEGMPLLQTAVLMVGSPKAPTIAGGRVAVLSWSDFLAKGTGADQAAHDARLDERLAALEPGGLASLIYTSGTTGPPKGVMLSHGNLSWTANAMAKLASATEADRSLSYLPLSHIAEQVFSMHGHITAGYELFFAESIDKVPQNLKEAEPTIFFGVPRIWEKFYAAIDDKLSKAPPARRRLAEGAMRAARAYFAAENAGRDPSLLARVAHAVADRVVLSKVREAVGFRRARFCVSGAAPIAPSVLEFFSGLGIIVYEVYGQSEDTGPTSITRPGNNRVGTVGPPITGVEVRFGDDGEILVRGPNVFMGYFKEPEASAETVIDGWLHSGDLGKFDEAGNLVITGRKKEIIITAGGKNITPKNIESALKEHDLISEAVVVGDRRKYLTVLLVVEAQHASGDVKAEIQRVVDSVNQRFARVESVKKFHVLPGPLSIEAGELTPTLKVKRRVVYERYAREIDAMYAGDEG